MKRRPRFLVIIASAVMTFSILMATVGPRHFKHGRQHFGDRQHGSCETQTEMDLQKSATK